MKYFQNLVIVLFLLLGSCTIRNPGDQTDDPSDLPGPEEIIANISLPQIPDYVVNVKEFGALGDGQTDDLPSFLKAIAHIEEQGGGEMTVPAGRYHLAGPLHLTSHLRLHLEEGSTLEFSDDPSHYLPVVKTSWEGTFLYNYSPFIYARECSDVAITGNGVIDGEASETWNTWKEKQTGDQLLSRDMNHRGTPVEERIFGEGHFLRPHLVQLFDCDNVLVEGIRLEDSPFWCLHLLRCNSVTIRGISYDAFNKNNDGIDPEYSRNVLIEDVEFNNADDNVAIKAGRDYEGRASEVGSENIVVRKCRFRGLHAIVIGSEMSAGVKNVHVYDCTYAGDLKRGIYLKSNPDRGGFIRDLYVDNVDFGKVEDCIYITSYYHNEGEGHVTEIEDIYFRNIQCAEATGTGIVLQGFPSHRLGSIHLENIVIKKAANALSMEHTEDIRFSEVVIGDLATAPSHVQ